MKKALVILVDGMRPDGLKACGHPFLTELEAHSHYTYDATTVMPSVTLPCHMSLFHSVDAQRHGILTNTYVPQVRPVNGICEVLKAAKKNCAMFYNWEQLRDLSRPGNLCYSRYIRMQVFGFDESNQMLTDDAISLIKQGIPDFTFLYLGWTDEEGHAYGWMKQEYITSIYKSMDCVERITRTLPDDYLMVLLADHGGHERSHGTEMPEDMKIPLFFYNRNLQSKVLDEANIIDVAPSVINAMGLAPDPDWEGKTFAFD